MAHRCELKTSHDDGIYSDDEFMGGMLIVDSWHDDEVVKKSSSRLPKKEQKEDTGRSRYLKNNTDNAKASRSYVGDRPKRNYENKVSDSGSVKKHRHKLIDVNNSEVLKKNSFNQVNQGYNSRYKWTKKVTAPTHIVTSPQKICFQIKKKVEVTNNILDVAPALRNRSSSTPSPDKAVIRKDSSVIGRRGDFKARSPNRYNRFRRTRSRSRSHSRTNARSRYSRRYSRSRTRSPTFRSSRSSSVKSDSNSIASSESYFRKRTCSRSRSKGRTRSKSYSSSRARKRRARYSRSHSRSGSSTTHSNTKRRTQSTQSRNTSTLTEVSYTRSSHTPLSTPPVMKQQVENCNKIDRDFLQGTYKAHDDDFLQSKQFSNKEFNVRLSNYQTKYDIPHSVDNAQLTATRNLLNDLNDELKRDESQIKMLQGVSNTMHELLKPEPPNQMFRPNLNLGPGGRPQQVGYGMGFRTGPASWGPQLVQSFRPQNPYFQRPGFHPGMAPGIDGAQARQPPTGHRMNSVSQWGPRSTFGIHPAPAYGMLPQNQGGFQIPAMASKLWPVHQPFVQQNQYLSHRPGLGMQPELNTLSSSSLGVGAMRIPSSLSGNHIDRSWSSELVSKPVSEMHRPAPQIEKVPKQTGEFQSSASQPLPVDAIQPPSTQTIPRLRVRTGLVATPGPDATQNGTNLGPNIIQPGYFENRMLHTRPSAESSNQLPLIPNVGTFSSSVPPRSNLFPIMSFQDKEDSNSTTQMVSEVGTASVNMGDERRSDAPVGHQGGSSIEQNAQHTTRGLPGYFNTSTHLGVVNDGTKNLLNNHGDIDVKQEPTEVKSEPDSPELHTEEPYDSLFVEDYYVESTPRKQNKCSTSQVVRPSIPVENVQSTNTQQVKSNYRKTFTPLEVNQQQPAKWNAKSAKQAIQIQLKGNFTKRQKIFEDSEKSKCGEPKDELSLQNDTTPYIQITEDMECSSSEEELQAPPPPIILSKDLLPPPPPIISGEISSSKKKRRKRVRKK